MYSGAEDNYKNLQKTLFDRAFNARQERLSNQSREEYGDKYKLLKVHWLTIEQALIDVIEESGELPEFEKYIGLKRKGA